MMRRTPDEEWGIADLPIKKVTLAVKWNADVQKVVKRIWKWLKGKR